MDLFHKSFGPDLYDFVIKGRVAFSPAVPVARTMDHFFRSLEVVVSRVDTGGLAHSIVETDGEHGRTFDERSKITYNLWWKGLEIGEEINAFAYSMKQWEESPPSLFKYNVLKEHIEL